MVGRRWLYHPDAVDAINRLPNPARPLPDGPHAGVVIAGSAGVGKTRLAREAMAAARNCGWAVHWVAGTVAAQSIPLGAFAQWADRLEGNPFCSW